MGKKILTVILMSAPILAAANSQEIEGRVRANPGCAEAGLELVPKGEPAECLGYDGKFKGILAPGRTYWVKGYRTEDGFFVEEIVSDYTLWEVLEELNPGRACPPQAKRNDAIAYQVNGNGGYVCFLCDYKPEQPRQLVVDRQTKCPLDIECQEGICQ